jgi:hypothetical protein
VWNPKVHAKFAEHLHHHSFAPMHTIMAPLHFTSKGKMMDTLEKFHIANETHNNQINDMHGQAKRNL